MNWAPPLPPNAPDATDDSPDPEAEVETERRRRSATPAATWIALLGSGLVLTAAVAVVASNWDTIGQSLRVAGLAAVTAGLLLLAERSRSIVPATAGIVAHAGTFLTGFAAIAVMSLFGFTWPGCLAVGGSVIVVATALQARRWRRVTMHAGQVAGIAMAATGAAAMLGTTAGLLAGLAAVGVHAIAGSHHRSVGLALIAVLSPVLTALADAGIGAGTLERAGLVGEQLGWSGPLVGLVAATVLASVALARRSSPLMLLAVLSPVFGVVTGLASIDGSAIAWWCVPALFVLAGELGIRVLPDDRFARSIRTLQTGGVAVVAAVAWFAPMVVIDLPPADLDGSWAVPLGVTSLALALVTWRWRCEDAPFADLGLAATAATAIGVLAAFDVAPVIVAGAAIAATAGAGFASRRIGAVAVHGTAFWALVALAQVDQVESWTTDLVLPLVLLGALVSVVLALRARLAAEQGLIGALELSIVAAAAAGGALGLTTTHGPAVGMTAVAAVVALSGLLDRRHATWGVGAVGAAGLFAFDAATTGTGLESTYWIGWAAATVALGSIWIAHRDALAGHAAAAASVLTAAAAAGGHGVPPEDVTVMAMLAVVALTGVAATLVGRTPLDSAAITAGALLASTTAFDMHPAWMSAAWVVLGVQITTYGSLLRSRELAGGGALVALVAAISWIWTTGFDEWFVELVEPLDIRSDDVWFALLSIAALVCGLTARSTLRTSTWLAYSPALLVPAIWLTDAELDRSPAWAIPLLLTVGVSAAALGAWHRLAAPLVGGTAVTLLGVFLATGSDLRAIPVWAWLGLGGATLIGTAVGIERSGRKGWSGMAELVSRWE